MTIENTTYRLELKTGGKWLDRVAAPFGAALGQNTHPLRFSIIDVTAREVVIEATVVEFDANSDYADCFRIFHSTAYVERADLGRHLRCGIEARGSRHPRQLLRPRRAFAAGDAGHFARKKNFQAEFQLRALFESPTVAGLSALIVQK